MKSSVSGTAWAPNSVTKRASLGQLAHAAGVAPLQRHVLPHQKAGFVGRVVELGPAHMGVDAQEVETRILRVLHVSGELVCGGLSEGHARRALVGALQEEALAVD